MQKLGRTLALRAASKVSQLIAAGMATQRVRKSVECIGHHKIAAVIATQAMSEAFMTLQPLPAWPMHARTRARRAV